MLSVSSILHSSLGRFSILCLHVAVPDVASKKRKVQKKVSQCKGML